MNRLVALARLGLVGFAAASLSLSTGCGMDVGVSGSTGTGGHDGGAGGGCSTSNTSVGVGGSSSSTTTSTSTGGATLCGGEAGAPCAAGEYCDFPSNSCGFADEGGTCKPIPMACDTVYFPTCGCDGKIYGNDCVANSAGYDVAPAGTCTPPAGMFACGQHFCNAATQYCQRDISDVSGWPDDYFCPQLPAACAGTPSCGCIVQSPCGQCTTTSDGGLMVTCPGG